MAILTKVSQIYDKWHWKYWPICIMKPGRADHPFRKGYIKIKLFFTSQHDLEVGIFLGRQYLKLNAAVSYRVVKGAVLQRKGLTLMCSRLYLPIFDRKIFQILHTYLWYWIFTCFEAHLGNFHLQTPNM